MKNIPVKSIGRYKIEEEHMMSDELIKSAINIAFMEDRAFEIYPDRGIIENIKSGNTPSESDILQIVNNSYNAIAGSDQTILSRLTQSAELTSQLTKSVALLHRALATCRLGDTASARRFVIIRENPGVPTFYHISDESTVLAKIGHGPTWKEIPTIYIGLNTCLAVYSEAERGGSQLEDAFKMLIMVEERAIQTGFVHSEAHPANVSRGLNLLTDSVIEYVRYLTEAMPEKPSREPALPFTSHTRHTLLKMLNARPKKDELNFDHETCLKSIKTIESMARRYKADSDLKSLTEVIKILVAASGHDIHEVRNRANIILERIFAPKEYDAPLATSFMTTLTGSSHHFEFVLPVSSKYKYFLRVYTNGSKDDIFTEKYIQFEEIPLKHSRKNGNFFCTYTFKKTGQYDYTVVRKKNRNSEWINEDGSSGRVNVLPDVRGEIILEIFTDIHGHTKAYWHSDDGHPGLLYNENGEVIRLGNFSDITAHLEDIREKYYITSIYLLGAQKRGSNREDWAPEASSPSPFSPMSLIDIEPSLGGENEFRKLISKAHSLGIKIIIDVVPHINRRSSHLPDELAVQTYDADGNLVLRASTDGRYGSWNDGKLLNYRKFEVWKWVTDSVRTLIDAFEIDGIRFDSAHAVPIMMKKNNTLKHYSHKRSIDDMVEGTIIVNDREYGHYLTTGYYDSECRERIAVPFHQYMMQGIERKLRDKKKNFFINIAECYWGHEKYLTRSGLIPYNSSLFKICENIVHGKTDVREIYHLFDNYFPSVLPPGAEFLGIFGNHDERRALNTFGLRGLRACIGLTSFMSNIIMDYEGSAEGESWKVYLDNIYVNWNQFEYAAHRSVDPFYRTWYKFHRTARGKGYMIWAGNNMVAAAMKFCRNDVYIGAFNFSESTQNITLQFDNPSLPINDDDCYILEDTVYSKTTGRYGYYTGKELKASKLNTVVSFTDRVKLFRMKRTKFDENYLSILTDSFYRLCELSDTDKIESNFAFYEICKACESYEVIEHFITETLSPQFKEKHRELLKLGIKRAVYYMFRRKIISTDVLKHYKDNMENSGNNLMREIASYLVRENRRGNIVFMSAEADPFSKSGGLANVVYELPRKMAQLGENVYVITALYRFGTDNSNRKMQNSIEKYQITYTGKNVKFYIMDEEYTAGVHYGIVDGVHYFLLDHYEFFDGLYWGITSSEKMRRRIAFSRACAEVIVLFGLNPYFTFTNDAYAGIFNGIVRSDSYYSGSRAFKHNKFLHIVHNGGWQYFDSYHRYENGFDLFNLFNLPSWRYNDFTDPHHNDRINCMAAGIRFSDKVITVSPSYAKQIEFACDGLESILNEVIGISNAIGEDFKSRLQDQFNKSGFIEKNYSNLIREIKSSPLLLDKIRGHYPEILQGPNHPDRVADPARRRKVSRIRNKMLLQCERGLTVDPDIIMFTMIHRVSEQKGFQLLLEASEGIFKNLNLQGIIGGAPSSGDGRGEEIARGLYMLGGYYPKSVSVSIGFQDICVPLMSSDLFLMPSMHEPGGISQLEAFAAGCLVVARATGGLKDTVDPIRQEGAYIKGNGFLFSDYHSWAFYDAMHRAVKFLTTSSEKQIAQAYANAEESAYYWDRPATEYINSIYGLTETVRLI